MALSAAAAIVAEEKSIRHRPSYSWHLSRHTLLFIELIRGLLLHYIYAALSLEDIIFLRC